MKRILVAVFAFSLYTGEVLGYEINTQKETGNQSTVKLRSVNPPKKIDWVGVTENISHRARIVSGFTILAGSHALRAACIATRLAPLCFPMFPISILHNKFYTFTGHTIASKTAQGFSNGMSQMLSTAKKFAKKNICSSNAGWLESFTRKKACSFIMSLGSSEMNLSKLTGNKTYQFVTDNLFIYVGWLGSIALNCYGSSLINWLYDVSTEGIRLGHDVISTAHRKKLLTLIMQSKALRLSSEKKAGAQP